MDMPEVEKAGMPKPKKDMTLREFRDYMLVNEYNAFKVCPVNVEGKEAGICIMVRKETESDL